MGRKPAITHKKLMKAIEGTGGIMNSVAHKLKVDWHTAKKAVESDDEARAAFEAEGEKVTDLATSIVLEVLNDHDLGTAKWWLERKGAGRGFNPNGKVKTAPSADSHLYVDDLKDEDAE